MYRFAGCLALILGAIAAIALVQPQPMQFRNNSGRLCPVVECLKLTKLS